MHSWLKYTNFSITMVHTSSKKTTNIYIRFDIFIYFFKEKIDFFTDRTKTPVLRGLDERAERRSFTFIYLARER